MSTSDPAPHPLIDPLREPAPQTTVPAKLSFDRRNSDPAVVTASQRWRLLAATARVVSTHGYAAATIDKITAEAGVTKKTFYKFFSSKEDAFLACYEAVDVMIDRVIAAGVAADTTDDAVRACVRTYLQALAAVPDLTAIFLIEALAASPRIRRRRAERIEFFAQKLRDTLTSHQADSADRAPVTDAQMMMLLGGLNEICVQHLNDHDATTLPTLEPLLHQLILQVLSINTGETDPHTGSDAFRIS